MLAHEEKMGTGTKADPWKLKTPTGTSAYEMYRDETLDPPAIVCQVGGTRLLYDMRAIEDLHASAAPMSRSRPSRGRSRPGAARRRTRSVAGMA